MSNATYTPGPWENVKWECHEPTTIKAANGVVVAETYGNGRRASACLADARLISAAPELLAACEVLLADLHYRDGAWTIGPMSEAPGGKLEMLRNAIAKARGVAI